MDEQILKDLIATAQADNYDWDIVLKKFPELQSYDPQLLKDYVATAEADNYNYNVINKKFPEFFGETATIEVEKKNLVDGTSPMEPMDSTLPQAEADTLSESEELTGYETLSLFKEDEESEATKKFNIGVENVRETIGRIPLFLAEQAVTAFASKEQLDYLNSLPPDQREIAVTGFAGTIPGVVGPALQLITPESTEFSNEARKRREEIESTLKQYETSIGEDFANLDIAQATTRVFNEVVGTMPQLVQAMVPYVGLVSLGLGSAAQKSGELQREGEDLGLRTSGNAIVSGAAEAVFEIVTQKLGNKLLKAFKVNPDEAIQSFGKSIKELFIDSNLEGASELATTITQNLSDALIQGKDVDVNNVIREAIDAYIIGTATGGTLTGSGKAVKMTRQVAEKNRLANQIKDTKYNTIEEVFEPSPQFPEGDLGVSKTEIDKETLDVVSNPASRKFLVEGLRRQVEKGDITKEDADARLRDFDRIKKSNERVSQDAPEDLRPQIVEKLREQEILSEEIEGLNQLESTTGQPQKENIQEKKDRIEQINQEINAIQEQETGDIPDAERAKGVPEVEEEVREPSIEEKRRQEKGLSFEEAGKESKDKSNGKILGQWILDNAKVGDTITDEDGNGYEVVEINRRGNVEIRAFEINENGEKVYLEGAEAYRIVSKTQLNQGDLFEYGYTDYEGNKVVKQYKYNAKTEEEVVDSEVQMLREMFSAPDVKKEQETRPIEEASKVSDALGSTVFIDNKKGTLKIDETEGAGKLVIFESEDGTQIRDIGDIDVIGNRAIGDFNLKQEIGTTQEQTAPRAEGEIVINTEGDVVTSPEGVQEGPQRPATFFKERRNGTIVVIDERGIRRSIKGEKAQQFKMRFPNAKKGDQVRFQLSEDLGTKPQEVSSLNNLARKVEKAISQITEGVSIVVPDTQQDYDNLIDSLSKSDEEKAMLKSANGFYDSSTKTAYINPSQATDTTIVHEAVHGLMSDALGSWKKADKVTNELWRTIRKNADNPELISQLEAFAEMYVQDGKMVQSSEAFSELMGILSSSEQNLNQKQRNAIQKFFDELMSFLGLKRMTVDETFELIDTLSARLASGEMITASDMAPLQRQTLVESIRNNNTVDNFIEATKTRLQGLFNVAYTVGNKINELKSKGILRDENNLSFIPKGSRPTAIFPDSMFVGIVSIDGKILFKGGGGLFYPINTGDVWASSEKAANQIAKSINQQFDDGQNTAYLILVKGSKKKLFSTTDGVAWSVSALESMVDRGLVSKSQMRSALILAARKNNTSINIDKRSSASDISNAFKQLFKDPNSSTYSKRGNIVDSLIGELAKAIKDKNQVSKIIELFGGDTSKTALATSQNDTKTGASLSNMISNVVTEKMINGLTTGDVYAVIEVNSKVKTEPSTHQSYDTTIKTLDGSQPKIVLLKETEKSNDVLVAASTKKPVIVAQATSMTVEVRTPMQRAKTEANKTSSSFINEVIKSAKEKNISNAAILKYLKEVGVSEGMADKALQNYSRLGVKEKSAPSAKRVTGQPKRKKVTVDEYAALKDQIRLEAKAAREAVTSYKNAGKKIAEAVKVLGGKGKITLRQASAVAKKILRTNLTNTKQVDALLDYVQKIYERAELAEMISNARGRIEQAKKNLASKVGTNTALKSVVQDVLSLDPTDVPLNLLPQYVALVQSFGERKAVLNLPEQGVVMQTANAILDSIQESFDATTRERVEDANYDLDQSVKEIIEDKIDTKNILNPDVKKLAQKLNSLTKKDIEGLVTENKDGVKNYAKVENLKAVKREMSKGYAPKVANDLMLDIESQRNYNSLENEGAIANVQNRGVMAIGRTIASIKSLITGRGITQEQLRSITFIGTSLDNILGNLNKTQFREKIIDPVANAFSMMTDKMKDIRTEYLQTAEYLLSNDGFVKRSRNAILKSKYKVQLYLLEKENLSNIDSNQVAPAIDFLNETIKYLSKDTSARRNMNKDILEEIREEFAPNDGPLDFEKLENSLSKNEMQAATLINQAYNETSSMYEFVSSVIRGEGLKPLNNYVHHSVLMDLNEQKKDNELMVDRITKPSTKSKTIIERTPGAKAINFDPISSADRGIKMMLTDYYMTNPIREVRSLINKLKSTTDLTQFQKNAFEDLDKVFEESIQIVFGKSLESITGVDNFFNKVEELGYYAALASIPRAAAEFGSNFAGALIMNPKTLSLGITNFGALSLDSTSVAKFASAIGSKSRDKLAPKGLGGKLQQELTNYNVTSGNKGALIPILDKADFISKNTVGRIGNVTADVAQKLLSTPDMAVSRPMYFQTFVNEFQKITGEKLTSNDLQAIADGDTKILDKYPDAVSKARDAADTAIERLSGTTNPFKQPLKYQLNVKDSGFRKIYKKANKYMASFYSVENNTATEAVIALFHSGEISRRQATALLAMVTTRMSVYMTMYAMLQSIFDQLISNAFGLSQEEDEEDEDYGLLTIRQAIGSVSTLILRRSLGSVSSIPIMYGIEKINEEYLDALRGGYEYDKFKNGMVYVPIREDKSPIEQGVSMLSGAKGPALATIARLIEVYRGMTGSEKQETRDKYEDELYTRMAIEAMGNIGLLPFYKDIRRIVIEDTFSEREYQKLMKKLQKEIEKEEQKYYREQNKKTKLFKRKLFQ